MIRLGTYIYLDSIFIDIGTSKTWMNLNLECVENKRVYISLGRRNEFYVRWSKHWYAKLADFVSGILARMTKFVKNSTAVCFFDIIRTRKVKKYQIIKINQIDSTDRIYQLRIPVGIFSEKQWNYWKIQMNSKAIWFFW